MRVVEAVRTRDQPRLIIRLIPPLRPEPPRVAGRGRALGGRAGARPEGVVEVGGQGAAIGVEALGNVAALVEGVEDAGIGGGGVARDQALRAEGVDGLDGAAGVEFGHGVGAVVEIVRPRPRAVLLPGPQTVAQIQEAFKFSSSSLADARLTSPRQVIVAANDIGHHGE